MRIVKPVDCLIFPNRSLTSGWQRRGLNLNAPVGADGRLYIGVGIYHFNKPNIAYSSAKLVVLDPKYAFNIGLTTPTSDFNQITLYGDVFLQGGHNQFWAVPFTRKTLCNTKMMIK